MEVLQNFRAVAVSVIAGNELIVNGEVNTSAGMSMPKLTRLAAQDFGPGILLLNIDDAVESTQLNFKKVQYNERISKIDQFDEVWIFRNDLHEASLIVELL